MMAIYTKKYLRKILKDKYPRKHNKTIEKIISRLQSKVYNWNKSYDIPEQYIKYIVDDILHNYRKCKYCGEWLIEDNISLDHILPVARGGRIDDEYNVELICKRCNVRKGRLTEEEYKELLFTINHWDKESRDYVLRKLSSKDY
ncbi:MAG: HNH endonuclease [Thermotogota bacterium]